MSPLATTTSTTPRHPRTAHPRASLWFALLGAPVAWGVQEVVGWLIADLGCLGATASTAARPGLHATELIVSICALIVALAAFLTALKVRRRSLPQTEGDESAISPLHFLSLVAMIVSSAFGLAVIWQAIGPLTLDVCERVR